MKKIIFCLSLSICLMAVSLLNLSVCKAQSGTITISKTEFRVNEKGIVKITGLSQGAIDDGAWIGVEQEGTRLENTAVEEYISDLPADNTWEFKAPDKYGKYELRVLYSDNTLFGKVSFTVVPGKAAEGDIKISKKEAKLSEKISVTVNGLTKEEISNDAWIGVEKVGTKLENTVVSKYISELPVNNTWEFEAPDSFGKYEIRVFCDGTNDIKSSAFGKLEFSVVSSKAREGNLKLSKSSVTSGEKVTLTVNGLTEGEISQGAWIGIEKAGTKLENTITAAYIQDLPEGNIWEFKAPGEPGTYEIRIFCSSSLQPEEMEYAMFGKTILTVEAPQAGSIVAGYEGISDWAVTEVNEAKDNNLVTEKIMVEFAKDLTREEFCELAIKLYEKMSGKVATPVENNPFKDTNNPEVLKAYNLGVVKGVSDDSFAPNNSVTRQEIATMLIRVLKLVMPKIDTESAKFNEKFFDEPEVAQWAREGLMFLNQNGIFKGAQGYILPNANTTREQGIALVKRVFDKFFEI